MKKVKMRTDEGEVIEFSWWELFLFYARAFTVTFIIFMFIRGLAKILT